MYSTMYEGDRVRVRVLALANANERERVEGMVRSI